MSKPNQNTIDEDDSTGKGAGQVVPQYIESGMRDPKFGILLKQYAFLTPALVPILISVVIEARTGSTDSFRLTTPIAAGIAIICWRVAEDTEWQYFSPVDTMTGWKRKWKYLRRRFPLDRELFVENPEHGYENMLDSGIAEMDDGRMVALVRAPSRNTNQQETGEANAMVLRLTAAFRRQLPDVTNVWQTTFKTDPEEYMQQWKRQLFNGRFAGPKWRYVRAYIKDMIRQEQREESKWSPRKRRTYISVEVSPHEVRRKSTAQSSEEGVADKVKESVTGGEITDYQRQQMENTLRQRIRDVKGVARQVADTELEREEVEMVGPAEHAMLIAKYWRGVRRDFDGLSESDSVALSVWPSIADRPKGQVEKPKQHRPAEIADSEEPLATASVTQVEVASDGGQVATQAVKDTTTGPEIPDPESDDEVEEMKAHLAHLREGLFGRSGTNPISESQLQERLAPSNFDVNGAYITVGEQLCKSFWLANWPVEPASNFLEMLQRMGGVDYDFIVRGVSPSKSDAGAHIKEKIKESGATVEELRESHDPDSGIVNEKLQHYIEMYDILQNNPSSRAWWVNMYVTVRVGPERAYALADEEMIDGRPETRPDHDDAKRRALDNVVDTLVQTVEDQPAALDPITDNDRADLLFKSAFPACRDAYNADCKKQKRSITLSGSFAATFPFSTATLQEPTGMLFGRNTADGNKVVANQFLRDGAAHRLTGGRSGSGKTFFVGDQGLQWWIGGNPVDDPTRGYGSTTSESESESESGEGDTQ